MNGLDLKQFRDYIVDPTLNRIGLYSQAASRLVVATALAESGLRFLDQVDKNGRLGPAYGLFQMERITHDDIWDNFLRHDLSLAARVRHLTMINMELVQQLHGNHFYAAAMCRVHYFRIKSRLPEADDIDGLAAYWKKYYNTPLGKGTIDGFKAKAAPAFAI
ncbi:MAG: hypothetical protein WBK55_08315 [Alphaproteobacteria bacterium]